MSVLSLWLPILLSAIIVFIASSLIHMMLKYHRSDFRAVPNEDGFIAAVRPLAVPPGDYVVPHAATPEVMKTPEFQEKANQGPVIFMTVLPNGMPAMGQSLIQWFVYCLLVGLFAGYVASFTLSADASYMEVFRLTGTVAFVGYSLALLQNSIWYKKNWTATLKSVFDGLIYGLLTAGSFGWLWS